jgi:hypothetical protein
MGAFTARNGRSYGQEWVILRPGMGDLRPGTKVSTGLFAAGYRGER